ncbi:MAG: sigma-70 family RNA polymerase sigma factor [Ruminococcus sp.]|nr:sigma-70 family RNA polymerase sigma factor [Ruminococcus sp.]
MVSDTVLDAFCSVGSLKNEKAFRSWIMKILSAKIKRKQREYFADTVEITEDVEPAVDTLCEDSELKNAMESLDPQSRLILSMSVLEGYTSGEIAEICGIKSSTVRSRLSRIKKQLRLELGGDIL